MIKVPTYRRLSLSVWYRCLTLERAKDKYRLGTVRLRVVCVCV